jgi:hypothetical protein
MDYSPDKGKRARRRADTRRKNQRDALPKLHRDYKETHKNKKKIKDYVHSEDIDGEVSR